MGGWTLKKWWVLLIVIELSVVVVFFSFNSGDNIILFIGFSQLLNPVKGQFGWFGGPDLACWPPVDDHLQKHKQ